MTPHSEPIPYFDLKRQHQALQDGLQESTKEILRSGQFILSQKVEAFEKNFAAFCGSSYGIGVGSGTDALIFSLKACGIKEGDEVIVPSFTFVASAFVISHLGARPVFAEVDEKTYTVDPRSVEKLITRKTKAILPVHLYGQTADMDALMAISKKKKLKVIEDACQAHGAEWKKKKAGSFGDAGCFSFYPTKNLGAAGDGGLLVTQSAKLAENARKLRNLGRVTMSGKHEIIAWTSRLDAIQAGVLDLKLKHLNTFNDNRRKLAARYKLKLSGLPIKLPFEHPNAKHVYHLFVVRVPGGKRDALKQHLADHQIGSMIHYTLPVHRQPFYKKEASKARLKITDTLCGEILSLPMFPEMTFEEVDRVAAAIRSFYDR